MSRVGKKTIPATKGVDIKVGGGVDRFKFEVAIETDDRLSRVVCL